MSLVDARGESVMPASMVFRRARPDEADQAAAIVAARRDWLRHRGIDQWQRDPSPAVREAVAANQCWLLLEEGTVVGTATLTETADPDFWTPEEVVQPALYLSKAATAVDHGGKGLGRILLRAALRRACDAGIPRLRWDVWKTNLALQQYYTENGATYLRTVDLPHRHSGALFEMPCSVVDGSMPVAVRQ